MSSGGDAGAPAASAAVSSVGGGGGGVLGAVARGVAGAVVGAGAAVVGAVSGVRGRGGPGVQIDEGDGLLRHVVLTLSGLLNCTADEEVGTFILLLGRAIFGSLVHHSSGGCFVFSCPRAYYGVPEEVGSFVHLLGRAIFGSPALVCHSIGGCIGF
jgi:hypothetical protein